MAKNKDLQTHIQDMPLVIADMDSKPEELVEKKLNREKALDAILRANPADPQQFRKAFSDHVGKFWKQNKNLGLPDPIKEQVEHINTNNDFLDPTVDPDFKTLQQAAVAKRVLIGLQGAEDQVLTDILHNNAAECRAYLETKSTFGPLSAIPNWKPQGQAPESKSAAGKAQNSNEAIISDAILLSIQAQAAKLVLIKKIEQAQNSEQLNSLLKGIKSDDDVFFNAAKALGFPDNEPAKAALVFFKHSKAQDLDTLINDHIQKNLKEEVKTKYQEQVKAWRVEDALNQKELLLKDTAGFKQHLQGEFQGYFSEDEDVNWAKGIAGQRFIAAFLPTLSDKTKLLSVINASTSEMTQVAVGALLPAGDTAYIKEAVKKDHLAAIKIPLVEKIILMNSDLATVNALVHCKDLESFKGELRNIGITEASWLTSEQQKHDLQKIARARSFELHVDKISTWSADRHPVLIAVFNALKPEKQEELLKNNNNEIRHLLNAQDVLSVKHFLGKEVEAQELNNLINENKNNAIFRTIHNSELAKILIHINPTAQINAKSIKKINTILKDHAHPSDKLDAPDAFKNLVDLIDTECKIGGSKDEVYKQFGMNEDGTAFEPDIKDAKSRAAGFKKQETYNQELIVQYRGAKTNLVPAILEVLLGVPKSKMMSRDQLSKLLNAFTHTLSLTEFFEAAEKISDDKTFIEHLKHGLSSSSYNEIQIKIRKNRLQDKNPEIVTATLDKLNDRLDDIENLQKDLTKKQKDHELLLKVLPVHLFNPSFKDKVRMEATKMKAEYEDMANNCSIIVDQLRRDKITLQDYLSSLPSSNNTQEEIEEVRARVIKQQKKVKDNLAFYLQVQEKLDGSQGILNAINKTVEAKHSYYYKNTDIKLHRHPADKPTPLPTGPVPDENGEKNRSSATTNIDAPGGEVLNFLLNDTLGFKEACDYDVTYKINSDTGSKLVSFGRYVETHPYSEAVISTVEGRRYPTKFEVAEFPKKLPGMSDEDLVEARVNFAMDMAVSIVGSLDDPPSKENKIYLSGDNEEELSYIWTALVVLGEKDPNMKYSKDIIEVDSRTFKPESQQDSFFGVKYFTDNSLYKDAFQKNEDVVNQKIKHSKDLSHAKLGHKKEATEQAQNSMKAMKSSVQTLKKEIVKDEGPAPDPDTPSASMN